MIARILLILCVLTVAGCNPFDPEGDRVKVVAQLLNATQVTRIAPPDGPFILSERERVYYSAKVGERVYWVSVDALGNYPRVYEKSGEDWREVRR